MTLRRRHLIALALCAQLLSAASHAQTARSGGAPSAQVLQQMQQLAAERTSLQAENAKMKKQIDDLTRERDELKKGRQAIDLRARADAEALGRSNTQRESTEQELTQTKAKIQELIAKFRETVQTLREVENENATGKQTLASREQELKTCIDRNLALYHLNDEVLTRMEKRSVFTRVAEAEPFTRIKRVQLENLIDEYKSRADEQKITTPAPPVVEAVSTARSAPASPAAPAAPAPPPVGPGAPAAATDSGSATNSAPK